ncbi:MAG: hypothetical protein ACJ75I_01995 [Solirubrobacterales bacterium]
MPSFAVSIALLSVAQAAIVALPGRAPRLPDRLSSRWWGLVPPASIVVVIGLIALYASSADALAVLALVAVPPLAAVALAALVRRARPVMALAVVPLFALAWASSRSLAGETAALALTALACVTLGVLLAAVVAPRWLKLGVYAMALVDTVFVAADLLQGPNATLVAAAPPGGLPRLHAVYLGQATMGFGDVFIAAVVGALLARQRGSQLHAAALAAILGLAFDLLFFAVDLLPTTVPIAVTLALLEARDRRRSAHGARARERPAALDVREPAERSSTG